MVEYVTLFSGAKVHIYVDKYKIKLKKRKLFNNFNTKQVHSPQKRKSFSLRALGYHALQNHLQNAIKRRL